MNSATIDANGHVTYGDAACTCRDGTIPMRIVCPTCKGTGKGVRGGYRGCKQCHGLKTAYDRDHTIQCSKCNGTIIVPADRFSTIQHTGPVREALKAITITVVRQDRYASFNESNIGAGRVWSVVDYGRIAALDNAEIATDIRGQLANHTMQYYAVVNAEDVLASQLVVLVTRDGYSIKAVWGTGDADTEQVASSANREVSVDGALDGRTTMDIIAEATRGG